ncbi:MAG TPA: P-II family nitrogen regulator [Novosphingobium sp.]|nr:P-II family nitrogen regulator [Novosphingobium sp.]
MIASQNMIEIRAVIRPARLEPLRVALRQMPQFPGMSVIRTEGCSALWVEQAEPATIKRDLLDYTPKVMVVMVADETAAEALCDIIHRIAHTGRMGDGLIWTTRVERFIRITAPAA